MADVYYQAQDVQLWLGNTREVLAGLPADSVHCVVTSPPYFGLRRYLPEGHPDEAKQIGLESSVEEYVEALVEVFGEVRRVLHPSGTVWLNIGDSYASGGRGPGGVKQATNVGSTDLLPLRIPGFAAKQLLLVPFRLAIALQEAGWWVRQDIIWSKPNPMPESVTDRPTTAHEHIFLLAKQPDYYFDQEAVREPNSSPEQEAHNQRYARVYPAFDESAHNRQPDNTNHLGIHSRPGPGGRNCRSVWAINPQATSFAHFATFPEELVRRCLLAGTSEAGCCPKCAAPWERVVKRERPDLSHFSHRHTSKHEPGMMRSDGDYAAGRLSGQEWNALSKTTTLSWRPTCAHPEAATPVPCVVMDPFSGSCTMMVVARQLGRHSIGIDISEVYLRDIGIPRLEAQTPSLLQAVEPVATVTGEQLALEVGDG